MKLDGPFSAKKILEKIKFSIAKKLFVFLIASFGILTSQNLLAQTIYPFPSNFPRGSYQHSDKNPYGCIYEFCNDAKKPGAPRDCQILCSFKPDQPGAPLECNNSCYKSDGGLSKHTLLNIEDCDPSNGDISNCDGQLTCGPCPGPSAPQNKKKSGVKK